MSSNLIPTLGTEASSLLDQALIALGPSQSLVTAAIPAAGIGGFLFDVSDEDRIELASDITDFHVEDNTAVQDNIALRPIRITLRGFVAELVLNSSSAEQQLSSYPIALAINTLLVPNLSPQAAQIAAASANAVSGALSSTQSQSQNLYQLVSSLSPLPPSATSAALSALGLSGGPSGASGSAGTRQQNAFNYFLQLWQSRVNTITVETPWGTFQNMAIENVIAIQPKETNQMTDFTVTLKQIRTTTTTVASSSQQSGRAVGQAEASDPAPNGTVGLTALTEQQTSQVFQGLTYNLPTG